MTEKRSSNRKAKCFLERGGSLRMVLCKRKVVSDRRAYQGRSGYGEAKSYRRPMTEAERLLEDPDWCGQEAMIA